MIKGHGGNVRDAAEKLDCRIEDIIDMSSNLNPIGWPEGFHDYLKDHLQVIGSLPEVDAGGICRKIADRYGLEKKNIIAGNGTTQLIYAIPQALSLSHSLILAPTYSDYGDALSMYERPFGLFFATEDNGFRPDMEALSLVAQKKDAVFICNPNNPTGQVIPKEDLTRIVKTCPDTLFVIDESYLPFVPNYQALTFSNAPLFQNVLVLNSMSKIFRIPGLRTGFLIGHAGIIEKFHRFMTPWSVNSLAHMAVFYLTDPENGIDAFIKKTITFVEEERTRFLSRFRHVKNITFFEGHTPYILGKLIGPQKAGPVCDALLSHRILIRNCTNFKGLSDRFIRVSLKDRDTNTKLADKLIQILGVNG
ncbi:MAG: pyridoxal phosphate-dependent class II aminotransferase [Proteobacteria bacterium]|nr:pyridoxal phosphate-dependent class II aminotransferase [Pseudomonadota bacterium]